MKATLVKYSKPYADASGDEFVVLGDISAGTVRLESQESVCVIPIAQLNWFIDALIAVRDEARIQ